jgi:hypothetical protein
MPQNFVIVPVYYGLTFNAGPSQGSFSSAGMDKAIANLCSSDYFSAVKEFALDVGKVKMHSPGDVAPSDPPESWADPKKGFTLTDIANFLTKELDDGRVPQPTSFPETPVYVAIVKQGLFSKDEPNAVGYHYSFTYKKVSTLCAWVMQGSDLDGTTPIVAHEVVETLSNLGKAGEAADPCDQPKRINGVMASAYMNAHHACVVPGIFEKKLLTSLGGLWPGNPAVARRSDGCLELFLRGKDANLYHARQTAPNSSSWSRWEPMGGSWHRDPVVAVNADGRLEVFIVGDDDHLYHAWQTKKSATLLDPGDKWSGWEPVGEQSLGGLWPGKPTVGGNADGRLEVFLRGNDANLYHAWQTASNSPSWSPWTLLGVSWHYDPVVAANADGRLELFVVGDDTQLWHCWQTAPSNGWYGDWVSLGGTWSPAPDKWSSGTPSVGLDRNGLLAVFMRGNDAQIYMAVQDTNPLARWSEWLQMPGGVWSHDPVVAANLNGGLSVFVVGDDTTLFRCGDYQSSWVAMPGGTWHRGPAAIGHNADGRLEVFIVGRDTQLYHAWQATPGDDMTFIGTN